jgi:hypothetical protein
MRSLICLKYNVYVSIYSNTTCFSFCSGVYCTLSDMFQPFCSGHFQACLLGGVVHTVVIHNVWDLVLCAKLAVYYHMLVVRILVNP